MYNPFHSCSNNSNFFINVNNIPPPPNFTSFIEKIEKKKKKILVAVKILASRFLWPCLPFQASKMTEMTRDAQFHDPSSSSPEEFAAETRGGLKRGGSKGEGGGGKRERCNGSTVICGGRKVDSGGENGTAFRPAKMSSKSGMAGCRKKR